MYFKGIIACKNHSLWVPTSDFIRDLMSTTKKVHNESKNTQKTSMLCCIMYFSEERLHGVVLYLGFVNQTISDFILQINPFAA